MARVWQTKGVSSKKSSILQTTRCQARKDQSARRIKKRKQRNYEERITSRDKEIRMGISALAGRKGGSVGVISMFKLFQQRDE